MTVVGDLVMVLGAAVAVIAAVGLIRLPTAFARFHAAGKASPVAFLITAIGAAPRIGLDGVAIVIVAVLAMVLTLPFGVHLLYRAVHRDRPPAYLEVDELARDRAAGRFGVADGELDDDGAARSADGEGEGLVDDPDGDG